VGIPCGGGFTLNGLGDVAGKLGLGAFLNYRNNSAEREEDKPLKRRRFWNGMGDVLELRE
jgi:hypothetical protein